MPDYDYSEYAETPDNEAYAKLADLALKLKEAELAVAEAEDKLKEAQKTLRTIGTEELPEYMEELGLEEFKHSSGLHIVIKDVRSCSLPKGDRPRYAKGLAWIEDRGDGKLLKQNVSLSFNKGQEAEAKAVTDLLHAAGYSAKCVKEVHPSTLRSYITKLMEAGVDVPEDIFGTFSGKQAVVK